ncbi:family 20 glycosylhydrolase [candidate division KSB1 bacterium]
MKRLTFIFVLGIILISSSCQMQSGTLGNFKLLPQPQRFEITGFSNIKYEDIKTYYLSQDTKFPKPGDILKNIKKSDKESGAQIVCNIDELLDIGGEGYTLDIVENQIFLIGKDKPGLFYAVKTLEQLLEDAKEQDVCLPLCSIRDYPLLAYRAIHLDMKHHLEKRDYYYKMIDKLASYKVNAIIAEMEDKIEYKHRPLLGASDALSISEWNELSDYAEERNIEISPLIQGLGHASFVLKHEKYYGLRDDPQSDWAFNPLDPKTYEVQFDMYLDAIEATPHGRYLHIGGDEVRTTGRGSGKSAFELQMIWLNKVCAFAEEHRRIPIFWDDMVLKHSGVYGTVSNTRLTQQEVDEVWRQNEHKLLQYLDQFPKNCVYMRWNYFSPQAVGNIKAMEWFRSKGMQVMGATAGQTRWFLMPLDESNIERIKTFSLSSIRNGLNGLLLTLWDDDSPHFELYSRGILAFAEYTWTGNKRSKEEIKSVYRHREFSNLLAGEKYSFIDQLEMSVAFYKNALIEGNRRNYLKQSKDPINEFIIDLPDRDNKGRWSVDHAERLKQAALAASSCDSISDRIRVLKSKAVRNTYALEVYEQVNKLVLFSANMLLTLESYDKSENEQKELEALKKIEQLPEEFKRLRNEFEQVYSKTRILVKPDDYILDQDHHIHLANQTISFDWQFLAEILFLNKLESKY